MLIGELSAKTGFSKDTIRFYERKGLITVSWKERRDNNYKEYSQEVLERLLAVKRLKDFGFTLNESAGILEMIEGAHATCANVSLMIEQKVALLDAKIQDMIMLRNQMVNGVKKCLDRCDSDGLEDNCPILISDSLGR